MKSARPLLSYETEASGNGGCCKCHKECDSKGDHHAQGSPFFTVGFLVNRHDGCCAWIMEQAEQH
jgi:hypothetical protein